MTSDEEIEGTLSNLIDDFSGAYISEDGNLSSDYDIANSRIQIRKSEKTLILAYVAKTINTIILSEDSSFKVFPGDIWSLCYYAVKVP